MGALADLSDVINRMSGGNSGSPEQIMFYKDKRVGAAAATAPTSGTLYSLWMNNGIPGTPGAAPGAAAVPTNTTAGALQQTDPGGGRQKWLTGIDADALSATTLGTGVLILYDRLFHVSGFSGTVITAQTVQGSPASPALTRYTNGVGNQIWAEIYTTLGTTQRTVSCSYTDQAGVASTSVATVLGAAGTNGAQMILPLSLAAGDTGVQAVNTATLSASTGTAGNWGITIAHPLAMVPVGGPGAPSVADMVASFPSLVEVLSGACLALAFMATSTSAPAVVGGVHFIEA